MQYQIFDGRLLCILSYNAVDDGKQNRKDESHYNNDNDRCYYDACPLLPFYGLFPVSLFLFIFINLCLTHFVIAFPYIIALLPVPGVKRDARRQRRLSDAGLKRQ